MFIIAFSLLAAFAASTNPIEGTITNLIGNYAFPIICCWVLFRDNKEQRQLHKEETAALTKAVENNTKALERLIEKEEGK